jgi:hypothetical protein
MSEIWFWQRDITVQSRFYSLTKSAGLNFLFPLFAVITTANGSAYKPANVTGIKFPCWTLFSDFRGTIFYNPARLSPHVYYFKG